MYQFVWFRAGIRIVQHLFQVRISRLFVQQELGTKFKEFAEAGFEISLWNFCWKLFTVCIFLEI